MKRVILHKNHSSFNTEDFHLCIERKKNLTFLSYILRISEEDRKNIVFRIKWNTEKRHFSLQENNDYGFFIFLDDYPYFTLYNLYKFTNSIMKYSLKLGIGINCPEEMLAHLEIKCEVLNKSMRCKFYSKFIIFRSNILEIQVISKSY